MRRDTASDPVLRRLLAAVFLLAPLLGGSPSRASAQAPPGPGAADTASTTEAPRVLHAAPDGDTLGTIVPGARIDVLGREGEWARVRVEGWVRVPPGAEPVAPAPLRGLTLRALRAEPDRYRGQPVRWRVQFVAVQRADSLRTDLRPGEDYILARDPGGEPGFLYVVVPPGMLSAVRQLVPLQQLDILARVRTGRSPLMGHPVLDLDEIRP